MRIASPVAVAFHRRVSRILPLVALWSFGPIGFRRDGRPIYPIAGAALTVTLKNSSAVTTNANSYTVVATPDASGLCYLVVTVSGATTGFSVSDTQNLRWSTIKSQSYNSSGQFQLWYVARKLAAASSDTFTFNCTSGTGCIMMLFSVTGTTRTGMSSVRQPATGALTFIAGAIPTPTFSNAAANTNNAIIAVASNASTTGGLTPNTGWTETVTTGDVGYATPSTGMAESHRNSGLASATINAWVTTGSATAGAVFAIEIDSTTPSLKQSNQGIVQASTSSVGLDFDLPLTGNTALTAFVYWNSASITASISDNLNGAWTARGGPQVGAAAPLATYSSQCFYLLNPTAASPTVTVAFSSAVTDMAIAIGETTGKAIDSAVAVYATQNPTTTPTSGSYTPTQAACTVVCGMLFGGAGVGLPSGSWTREQTFVGNQFYAIVIAGGGAQQVVDGTTGSQQTVSGIFAIDTNAPKSLVFRKRDHQLARR